jgi:hypothetical protein
MLSTQVITSALLHLLAVYVALEVILCHKCVCVVCYAFVFSQHIQLILCLAITMLVIPLCRVINITLTSVFVLFLLRIDTLTLIVRYIRINNLICNNVLWPCSTNASWPVYRVCRLDCIS